MVKGRVISGVARLGQVVECWPSTNVLRIRPTLPLRGRRGAQSRQTLPTLMAICGITGHSCPQGRRHPTESAEGVQQHCNIATFQGVRAICDICARRGDAQNRSLVGQAGQPGRSPGRCARVCRSAIHPCLRPKFRHSRPGAPAMGRAAFQRSKQWARSPTASAIRRLRPRPNQRTSPVAHTNVHPATSC